jgi:GT2 family glycosyltransferase/glycosyltransferase involved in cell wall biosynthesis
MNNDHDLEARLSGQLERSVRLGEELRRLSGEARRLGETEEPLPWWLKTPRGADTTISRHRRGAAEAASVTVVVPVHNAYEELRRCLWALARHTTYQASLLIIDDASSDPRVGEPLEMAANLEGVRVLRNVENLGFTATVNRALRSCSGDVVLLNSDTVVGPRWLEQLVSSAYSAPDIGTVTPVSDNAGAFSVPRVDAPNRMPLALAAADVARLLSAQGSPELAQTPTGNGFCLYIKWAVIDDVGAFDAEAFPRGYGEENDFCMRALKRGWRHVVDGRTYVHHEREASFGKAKAALSTAGRAKLDQLHPDYSERVREFLAGDAIAAVREQAGRVLAREEAAVRPRLLFVIHEGGGGAIATNVDLVRALTPEFDCFVFSSDRWTLTLQRMVGSEPEVLRTWPLERAVMLGDFSRPDYRAAFRETLARCRPELVHVRHVFKHTLDAPKMAADLAIPVVMSVHDHYTICPTIHLLDNTGHYCGGECSEGHGTCPTLKKAGALPALKHAFVYQWRDEMDAVLRCVDAFVTTSPHAREVHRRALPAMRSARFELIEHGRDLEQASKLAKPPVPGGKVRILVTGNLDRHKGAELIKTMRGLDTGNRLELHFLGEVAAQWRDLGVMHGTYEREDFLERVSEIQPAFIGIFSVVAETYNHALTEAWGAGVPVLVTDIGALGERVRAHGGGFLVPVDDPVAALGAVLAAADDPGRYAEETDRATLHDIPTVAQMTERYANLYRDVLDRRRCIAAPAYARGEPLERGVWKMTAVVPGRFPSAYVRVVRRYHHPEVDWKLRTRVRIGLDDLALDDADFVLVQRHAVPSDQASSFLDELRHRDLPLVLDLDDHLLASHHGDAEHFAAQVESMRVLLEAAALVTVSTPALAATIGELCRRVVVVPNQLDERLFLTGTGGEPPGPAPAESYRPIRLVYAGSPSHADDLAFLREVMAQLRSELPGRFELDVVGGEPASTGQAWYRRREIPAGQASYPDYVALLRSWRADWDIGVAPLLDSPFNRHKSDLKFLEYTGLGMPGVYSDVEPYATVVDGRTGLVRGNDVAAWCRAIVRLAEDAGLRDRMRTRAWNDVTGRRLLRQAAGELLQTVGAVREDRDGD